MAGVAFGRMLSGSEGFGFFLLAALHCIFHRLSSSFQHQSLFRARFLSCCSSVYSVMIVRHHPPNLSRSSVFAFRHEVWLTFMKVVELYNGSSKREWQMPITS
ncbi:hypothetical protein K474DRAFT_1662915 [Panus rudis PR-1116 ss-1]|nr:hypothetical protein K474DRAFT_1662915 [Panus rudis PR-1116 ss-1]